MRKHNRTATAYHEAGHAVADWHYHRPIRKVTIRPDKQEGTHGVCEVMGRSYLDGLDGDGVVSPAKLARILNNIQALLAGNVAQSRFNKRTVRQYHASSDYRIAVNFALLISSHEGVEHLLRWLRHETEQLVQRLVGRK